MAASESVRLSEDGAALNIADLTKTYPGVRALDAVSLRVGVASIHGIVGENGAGKSTLMKVVAGAIQQDAGTIEVWGTRLAGGDPHRASAVGVAMIYQELTIVPEMSAMANVLLGRLPVRGGVISRRRSLEQYRSVAELVGADIDPAARAGELSTSSQQLLEIMRALASGRRLVIMDEPTASLGPADIAHLHGVMANLRATGCSIIYVSHDLDAVLDICDSITVMREGRALETRPVAEWTNRTLVHSMLGDVALETAGERTSATTDSRELLHIQGLRAPGVDLRELRVSAGEIVGIAGLVGSGRTRLLRAIAGADHATEGSVAVRGRRRAWPRSPRQAIALGIALAPEDRKLQALVLSQASGWNVALGQFGRVGRGRPLLSRRIARWATEPATRMGLRKDRVVAPVGTLSGGNQQKVVLGRLLARGADCLLLDEPTRGIDVGAKAQIFATAREIVANGRAIVWSSSDLSEVVEHSDRIIVVAGGRAVAELPGGSSVKDILELAYSVDSSSDGEDGK